MQPPIETASLSVTAATPPLPAALAVDLHGAHDLRYTYATWLEDAQIPAAFSASGVMAAGVPQADGSLRPEPQVQVADVARVVRYMASLPLDANIATTTDMATKMPFIGRG